MATATYKLEVDWDNNGTFATSENITTALLYTPVTIERGRDVGTFGPLGGVSAARMTFELKNDDYEYHPANTSSALSGDLVPGRDVKFTTTAPSATGLFRGVLADFDVRPNPDEQKVSMTALGGLHVMANQNVVTGIHRGITTGAAIEEVLDAAGWDSGRHALDTGGSVLPIWWASGNALDALRDLLLAEGPGAFLFENGDGDIVFHDRHRRFTQTASTTSQATFRDTGTEPLYSIPHWFDAGWRNLINDAEITITTYQLQPLQVVWTYPGGAITMNAGKSRTLNATFDVSAEGLVAPVEDTDFTVLEGAIDSVTLGQTTGARSKVTFTAATSGTTVITDVQMRGTPWAAGDTFIIDQTNATSSAAYGTRSLEQAMPWLNENTAVDQLAAIVNDWKDPNSRVRIVIANDNSTRLTQILSREINDRITVIESGSGLSQDYWIERIEHDITDAGKHHRTVFDCVAVPASPLVSATEVFILDDATQGKLGTGKLGY